MGGNEVTQEQLERFWILLEQRISQGRRLGTSLQEIAQEMSGTAMGSVVEDIIAHVRDDNETLAVAMNRHKDVFRRHVLCFVEGGEYAGILHQALRLIIDAGKDCPDCIYGLP